jgi:hypothetical protein
MCSIKLMTVMFYGDLMPKKTAILTGGRPYFMN